MRQDTDPAADHQGDLAADPDEQDSAGASRRERRGDDDGAGGSADRTDAGPPPRRRERRLRSVASAAASAAEDDTESDGSTPSAGGLRRWADVVVPLVAAAVLAAGLVTWWRAGGHDSGAVAAASRRDTILIAATSEIETMNTLDYRRISSGLKTWMGITTGTLHDQIAQASKQDRQALADQQKISAGHVVDAAVVDMTADTATVIAAVDVTVKDGTAPKAQPTVKRDRFSADLVRVGGRWLLEKLDQVAVSIS
ncbi:MAG: hypothetical protein FWE71_07575 [Nocardioidaceae bacterium]|nr:hypothetical protein [Nocardioidaceae bacterium]MCL2611847.1 hypothetical protein [Nocardioidaceae bacterium]